MGGLSDLQVFEKAFDLSMKIFEVSKAFPIEEKYSLTDQIRRSSRSVCKPGRSLQEEAFKGHFILKVSDSDAENSETQIWLKFANSCGYISDETHHSLRYQ